MVNKCHQTRISGVENDDINLDFKIDEIISGRKNAFIFHFHVYSSNY